MFKKILPGTMPYDASCFTDSIVNGWLDFHFQMQEWHA